ncbi:MAG TPA: permease prefix domain 1-containing protein [Gemmataceae bacterium]|jgi:hypothetical protein
MDKLEYYLDRVCRSIGGPKSLRQHVRQELREHLLDAAAEHRAAGMSEEAALDRALADFGGVDEVRSELEETHGHRLLPVVIDKAMQWKEQTMRAKWLWMTWAHLALAGVIALEVLWIIFAVMYLVPKSQRLLRDGLIDSAILEGQGVTWMASFLSDLSYVGDRYTTWLVLLAIVVVGLFEWRVRSENKSFIRLSTWGTVAVALMVVGILTAGSLVIPYQLAAPASGRIARPYAEQQIASLDTSMAALEEALAKKDWKLIQEDASQASQAVGKLIAAAPAIGSLTPHHGSPTMEELRTRLRSAADCLSEAQQAAHEKDAEGVQAALRKFREWYEPVGKAAASPRS